jgi:hypothetical protein
VSLLALIRNEGEPDLRRVLAAAKWLDDAGTRPTVPALAEVLGWKMNRVRTAIAAGEERGKLRLEKHRPMLPPSRLR